MEKNHQEQRWVCGIENKENSSTNLAVAFELGLVHSTRILGVECGFRQLQSLCYSACLQQLLDLISQERNGGADDESVVLHGGATLLNSPSAPDSCRSGVPACRWSLVRPLKHHDRCHR